MPSAHYYAGQAQQLLVKYGFNGTGSYSKLSAADKTQANALAGKLDLYNNNKLC